MIYGLERRLFVENGPVPTATDARASRSSLTRRAWSGLDLERRLTVVEAALRPDPRTV